jgi:hypothetical protein
MKSEIGSIVYILLNKLWGKTPINNRIRSEQWWRNRLQDIFDEPDVIISPENLWDGKPAESAPIPLEVEFGMPDLNWETLIKLKPLKIEGFQIGEL